MRYTSLYLMNCVTVKGETGEENLNSNVIHDALGKCGQKLCFRVCFQ